MTFGLYVVTGNSLQTSPCSPASGRCSPWCHQMTSSRRRQRCESHVCANVGVHACVYCVRVDTCVHVHACVRLCGRVCVHVHARLRAHSVQSPAGRWGGVGAGPRAGDCGRSWQEGSRWPRVAIGDRAAATYPTCPPVRHENLPRWSSALHLDVPFPSGHFRRSYGDSR